MKLPRPGCVAAVVALAVMAANFAASAIGSLFHPYGRDQGIFAWVADVILSGGAPFADAWEHKGPASHYTFALVQLVFGRGMWGVRAFDIIAVAATMWLIVRIVRPRDSVFAALVGMFVFGNLHYRLGYWGTAQPDAWGGMLCLAAIAVLLEDRRHPSRWELLAGALVGLAAMYKLTFGAMLAPLAAFVWATAADDPRRVLARCARIGVGCGAVIVVGLGLLALQGGLGDFVEIQWQFNQMAHVNAHSRSAIDHVADLARLIEQRGLVLPMAVAIPGLFALRRRDRPAAIALFVSVATGVLVAMVQNKYYDYHIAPVFAPIAALAGVGIAEIGRRVGAATGGEPARLAVSAVLAVVLTALIQPPWNTIGWRTYVFDSMSETEYRSRFHGPDFDFGAAWDVAQHVRATTAPDDRVLVWAFEPLVLHLADRRALGRFGLHYPLLDGAPPALRDQYRRELLATMVRTPPAVVVVADDDANNLMQRSSRAELELFPELAAILAVSYVVDARVERYEVWRKRR